MTRNEAIELVLDKFDDANYELQSRLYDHDPEQVQSLAYRLADIMDRIACMEEEVADLTEEQEDDPMDDYNYVGHPAHY